MSITILIIIAVVLYSLFGIFLSRMGGKIDPNLGAAIFSAIALIVPLAYFLFEKYSQRVSAVTTTSSGITYAILAGVSIAIWNVLLIIIFAKGGNLSYVYPVIYGAGAILIPSLVGWLFFKEVISPVQAIGLGLILFGILALAFSKIK